MSGLGFERVRTAAWFLQRSRSPTPVSWRQVPSGRPASALGQRGAPDLAVCLGLCRDPIQWCGPPVPTSACRGCVPGSASRPVPPLPPVHGFPVRRVRSAGPTSTAASALFWLVLSVGRLGHPTLRPRRRGISQVPRRVPCRPCRAPRPRRGLRHPAPVAVADGCLPRVRPWRPPDGLTRLHRVTGVTARPSLYRRFAPVVASRRSRLDSR